MRLTCGSEAAPMGDRDFDRGQRARDDDRGRDHRSGRSLAVEHEVGAETEDARLQGRPRHLDHRAEGVGRPRGGKLGVEMARIELGPSFAEVARKSHGADRLRVPPHRRRERPSGTGAAGGKPQRRSTSPFRHEHQGDEQHGACRGEGPEQGLHQVDHAQIERQPGHVEQRRRCGARKKGADLIEVAQGLQAIAARLSSGRLGLQ